MNRLARVLLSALLVAPGLLRAESLLKSAEGTTWLYGSVDEMAGYDASASVRTEMTVRIAGKEIFEGKTLSRFETRTGVALIKAELIAADDTTISCHARSGKDGKMLKLEPPEVIVPANRAIGATWEVDGEVSGMKTRQRFAVAAKEEIRVPAGTFRALRFHCAGSGLLSFTIDRWFVAGTGIVKENTIVRGPSGGVLQRTTRELKKLPEITFAPPTPTPIPTATPTAPASPAEQSSTPETNTAEESSAAPKTKALSVEISSEPIAGSQREFRSDVPKLYVRWKGHDLPQNSNVRVAWIAEDVGGLVEPNFIIDQTETTATTPDFSARFTLARPEDGWAEGKYRLEIYLNDELAETLRVRIAK